MCTTTECGKVRKRVWGLPVPLGPTHWESPWNWVLWVCGNSYSPKATSHRGSQGIRTADFSKNLKAAATPAVFLQTKQNMSLVNSTGLLKVQLVGVPLGKPHMIFFYNVCVNVREKKRDPLKDSKSLPEWVWALFFFQFIQDILVLFAILKDKASLFPLQHSQLPKLLPPVHSVSLIWHQSETVGHTWDTTICFRTTSDLGSTHHLLLISFLYSEEVS